MRFVTTSHAHRAQGKRGAESKLLPHHTAFCSEVQLVEQLVSSGAPRYFSGAPAMNPSAVPSSGSTEDNAPWIALERRRLENPSDLVGVRQAWAVLR
jgi:hypothetical protein